MSNLFLKNISSKKEIIIIISVFIIGSIVRTFFGLINTSEDLLWYVNPYPLEFDYIQTTRLGFPKEYLFLPLKIFNSINARIIFIGLLTSFLNTISIYYLTKKANHKLTFFVGLLAILNIFSAKIDMVMVRQQISIYFFIFSISQKQYSKKMIIFSLFSILYHEAILVFYGAWFLAENFNRKISHLLKNYLFESSLISNLIMYFFIFDNSIIFLIFISILNKFTKSRLNKSLITNTFYIFQLILPLFYINLNLQKFLIPFYKHLNLQKFLIPSELAITRFIGFGVSYGILMLIANGLIDKKYNSIKKLSLLTFLLSYVLISLLELI